MTWYTPEYMQDTVDESERSMTDFSSAALAALARLSAGAAPVQADDPAPVGNQAHLAETMPRPAPIVPPPSYCECGRGWEEDHRPGCEYVRVMGTRPEETVASPTEAGNDSVRPESVCLHCGAGLEYVTESMRWVSLRGGYRVASCKTSPSLTHEPAEPGVTEDPTVGPTPHSTRIWQSVAGTEPKVTGQASFDLATAILGPEAAQRKANFDRSVAELRAELGEPAPVTAPVSFDGQTTELVDITPMTRPNWPAQPMEPEDDPEAMAAEMAPNTQEIGDLADRWQRREELRLAQAEHDRQSKALKAEREEVERELFDAVPTGYVATIEGRPVFEVEESKTTRVDVTKWQARNPNWKTGRYAVVTTKPRIKLVGD